jgi:hypothetical protein
LYISIQASPCGDFLSGAAQFHPDWGDNKTSFITTIPGVAGAGGAEIPLLGGTGSTQLTGEAVGVVDA